MFPGKKHKNFLGGLRSLAYRDRCKNAYGIKYLKALLRISGPFMNFPYLNH
jgi:hypothetical protein